MTSQDVAIKVSKVHKSFRLPHEKHNSIKGIFLNMFKFGKKTYDEQHVLKEISFEIKKGEFFGIVGRNGSGKSTLLKLLAEIYKPDEGEVQVNGKLTPFIELGVGFNQELSGRENVFLNGALLGFSRAEMAKMYDEIVDFAELNDHMDVKLKNFSSGMQVRLAFSIAVRADSDILLIDEVLAVGDAAFQQKCFNYFENLKRRHRTVVFVSHDMSAVRRFCQRAAYIKEGSIVFIGDPMEIADYYVEENIEGSDKKDSFSDDLNLSSSYSIDAEIKDENEKQLTLRVCFKTEEDKGLFVGISILKDGTSIAEISTEKELELSNSNNITYEFDKTILNAGAYVLTVALFKKENRELVAIPEKPINFIVKHDDISRGGALKLPDGWSYEKKN